ncbi:MAG: hypothetical protein ACE37B_08170 [Ilumatobacter sp.]|jgi:hypothetical protein|uniref:hypothetical protein n=1 Tax=Ilumatobacter sp. TaxID=1967498 RepID=UPI003919D718
MKLLPKPPRNVRVNTEDSLGHGMDAVIVMVLFLAAGFGLDRLVGTMPVFMVIMSLLGGVGLFAKFKYRYEQRMDELEAERVAKLAGPARGSTTVQTTNGEAA